MNDLWPTIGHLWHVNLIVTMIFMGLWPECIPFYASLTLFNDYISLYISVTWSSFLLQCVIWLYNIIYICDLTHFGFLRFSMSVTWFSLHFQYMTWLKTIISNLIYIFVYHYLYLLPHLLYHSKFDFNIVFI